MCSQPLNIWKYTGWRRWDNCFIRLLDGMLQAGALGSTDYQLRIPTKIRQIEILDAKPRLPSGSESEPIATHCLLPSCHMHRLSIICTRPAAMVAFARSGKCWVGMLITAVCMHPALARGAAAVRSAVSKK